MKTLPLALLALAVAAHAQEVTFNPPVWLREDAPPEHLPERRHHTMPSYPREARKSGEIGYVFLERHIAAEGNGFNYMIVGSQVILARAVMDDPWINEMKPAQQGGKPVEADIWYAFIFNPASASDAGPEASPRLLQVAPIFVPGKNIGSLRGHPAVPTRLTIDAQGAVTRAEVESPADAVFLPAIQQGTAHWSFAPARHNGQPAAATISLPVVIAAQPNELFAQGGYVPPRVLKRVRAFYPFALRRLRLRATVVVEFNVDVNGNPQDVAVRSSTNPVFEEEAVYAIKKWKFQAATKAGQPVVAHMAVPINFQFFKDNRDEYQVRGNGQQSDLPPEYRFDTPPVIRGTILPAYPYELLRARTEGSVTVEILVDMNGKVARTKVLEADHPELGAALAAALEMYRFDPALRDGKPTQALLKQEMTFRLSQVAPDTDRDSLYADYYLLRHVEKDPNSVVSAKQLDHPLHPISRRPPVFPANLIGQRDHGTALIEIVIDKDGRARIPRVVQADDPAFGYAAAQAAQFWRFDPPTVGGKAVLTKAQVPFAFAVKRS